MKTIIIIKQAKNRNVAHIYEHALLNFVEKELFSKGYLYEIDYSYSAYTIGNIIVLSLKADEKVIKLIFNLVTQFQPTLASIKWAAEEISNEYFRPYQANFDELLAKVKETSETKWQTWQQLKLTAPTKKSAAQYRSPEIQFLRRNDKLFEIFQIEFHTKNITPDLKPLASYVLYFLQLNTVTNLHRNGLRGYTNYCDGYDWNVNYYSNLDDFVGRRIFFTFKKGLVKSQAILDEINSETARLLKNGLAKKIRQALQKINLNNYIFNNDELFRYSGFVAGGKYFKQYATLENIEKIISQIEYSVELEKLK